MPPEASQPQINTRHLKLPAVDVPATPSATGPLDLKRPWVVEFRVVGTASTLQARVGEAMVIGRGDTALTLIGEPTVVPSTINWTVPVGVPEPGAVTPMVAVKVTF